VAEGVARPLGANVIAWRRAIAPGSIGQGSAFTLFAWQLQTAYPGARIRLETRPRPGQGDECQVSPQLTAEHETITKRVAGRRFPRRSRVKTNRRLSRSIVAFAGVVAVSAAVATAASARPTPQTAPGDLLDPRTYAPDGRLYLVLHASGVQKYTCQASGTWLFTDPEATLYKTTGASKPVGTHFLNFSTGRPVWQFKGRSSCSAVSCGDT